ncbi:MogA/MoaB family molybdenum cofactor biosynthesis protein [Anaerosphaera multitolerans]|uniref:Molybdenum cofactor biosynthesis protein B n=1 Tax=Anaerosphaera multitolerans TaxID=2487351 RepID=A0A437S558_9FIRM|nr:MogA/MoaB family molybdenum cofactor biosynthesis protein [Anaerosphaera multitolerans]RVU54128.1 MogA/MoaB family molybdenum cofactor biosynthesis protein [Anaerosphaera multitolerans]
MFRAYVITVSDSSYFEDKKDLSGPLLVNLLTEKGYEVVGREIIPDEKDKIASVLTLLCDEESTDLILTTGGTGFSQRDVTPEATLEVVEKIVPGFGEIMRAKSFEITKNAILSRETAGIRKRTLIINLPGSPKAAEENLSFIIDSIEHGLNILTGEKTDCGNMGGKR